MTRLTDDVAGDEALIASADEITARRPHWAMLGTDVTGSMTAEEAIQRADLDWSVELRKIRLVDGAVIPKRFASVRSDTKAVLGIVGSDYNTFDNRQAFAFADHLVDEGFGFDTAFQQRGGSVIGLTMKLPAGLEVAGGDHQELYLLLRTSHDGSKAIGAAVTIIRQRCTNQTELMLRTALMRWSVNHTSTLEARLGEAKQALGLTSLYVTEFQRVADQLASTQLELEEFERLLTELLPDRPRTPKVIRRITQRRLTTPTLQDELRPTAWGALQAVTEHFDWGRTTRSPEARFATATEGASAQIRNRLTSHLLQRG